jgi:D-xylose transport system substrate-binding protein
MKVTKIYFIIFFLFLGFVACNEQKSQFKVGFLLPSIESKRWPMENKYFEGKIKDLGGQVISKFAERDESKQYQQALELINEGVDAIVVISVNGTTSAAIVREAHKKGIKVIAYDGLIKNCDLDFFLTFDSEKVGEYLAQFMINKVPQGNYVILNGEKGDDNAVLIQNGLLKVLKPQIEAKKINLVYSGFMDDWSHLNATYYTDKILEYSNVEINAIISSYDGISDGIVTVLKARNLSGKIFVTGQDGEVAACNRIMKGEQSMTVYKSGKSLAYKCAEIVVHLIKNEKVSDIKFINNGRKDVPSLILDPVVVDKTNMQTTVVADGFLSMDEIMNYKEQ